MQKLIEKINNRINNLKDTNIDQFYQRCVEYLNKESIKSYDELDSDFKVIFTFLLVVSEIGVQHVEEIKKLFDRCKLFFANNKYSDGFYENYYAELEFLYNSNKIDLIWEDDYDNEDEEVIKVLFNLYMKNKMLAESCFCPEIQKYNLCDRDDGFFKQFPDDNDDPLSAIVELFKLCPKKEVFLQFLEINELIYATESIKEDEAYFMCVKCYSKNKIDRDIKVHINKFIRAKGYKINDNCAKINNYYTKLLSNIKKEKINNNKLKRDYENLISFIKKDNGYIDNINSYIDSIDDKEILQDFLIYVIKNNVIYNKKIESDNIELSKRQISSIELLFNKYKFNFKALTDNDRKEILNINNIEEILYLLSNTSLNFINGSSIFLLILKNFSSEKILMLDKLYKNNIIDENFIIENSLLFINQELYDNFISNIDLLNNIGLDKISKYNKNIFLISNELIKKRYKLFVDVYKIPIDNIYNYEFLENDYIFDMIDNFIELGFFEKIRNNPDYLCLKNKLMIKRLEIAKLIGMNVLNNDNSFIGSIVSGNNFYVNDSMLDELLIDYKDLYIDDSLLNVLRLDICDIDLSVLNKYEIDEFTYKINDTLLSKNRILRNYAALLKNDLDNDLFQAMLVKSINLSNEQILDISKVCGHKTKVK